MARRRKSSSFLTPQITGARSTVSKPEGRFSSTSSPAPKALKKSRYASIMKRVEIQSKRGGDGHYRKGLKDAISKVGGTLDKKKGTVDFGVESRTTVTKPNNNIITAHPPAGGFPSPSIKDVKLPPGDGSRATFAAKPMSRRKKRRYGFTAT